MTPDTAESSIENTPVIREMGFQLLKKRRIVYRINPIAKARIYEILCLSAILLLNSRNNMIIKLYQMPSLILGRISQIGVRPSMTFHALDFWSRNPAS